MGGRICLIVAMSDDDSVMGGPIGEDLVQLVEVGLGELGGQVEEVVHVVFGSWVFVVT